ncbi:hypothetical protein ABZY44_21850 [Streptomyces sp. NPDC006544]|uniref:hypothetical protein n=1 Tax=Streptomyces sp. NPDC006544 TaxID=3154583 RepID=UPI0033A27851
MSAWATVGSCLAGAVSLLLAATYGWDAWHKPRTTRRFQASARAAVRHTEADVAEDAAGRRKQREVALLEAWLRTPCHPRNTIPTQTRRTEEDQ